MLKKIKIFFGCYIMKMHNWTCNAEQGIPPTKEQSEGGMEGFWDYAKMYCKDCGKESDLNENKKRKS